MKIGHWHLGFRYRVSRVENARVGLKPDTRHLTPILGKGFMTLENAQKNELYS